MGSLNYDRVIVEIDDRTLTHLQIVIVVKLRRGESFLLSWRDAAVVGSGRSSVWLNPAIPLYFKFDGGREPTINPEWIERLTRSADGSQGLVILGEESPVLNSARPTRSDVSFTAHAAPSTRRVLVASARA